MLNANELEHSVEVSEAELERLRMLQGETANNVTRLADRIEHFNTNTEQAEGKKTIILTFYTLLI